MSFHMRRFDLILPGTLLMTLLLTACAAKQQGQVYDFTSFDSFVDTLETVAGSGKSAKINAFWNSLVDSGQVPFVMGEQVAFLYRGQAQSVNWIGDFTWWQRGQPLEGQQVGQNNIWVAYATFPTNARLDYQIVVNGQDGILDPVNPLQQKGGHGLRSVLAMPDYVFPQDVIPRDDVTPGSLSSPLAVTSSRLGYTLNYWVYTPAGYDDLADLPVIYVTDGQEYTDPEMGAMPIVLDNLIADGTIEPIIAVFIDPRDHETGTNRRQHEFLSNPDYAAFIAEELVTLIDNTYQTDPSPDRRAILGISFGGVNAAYCALSYPDVFHLLGMQSPAFIDDTIYDAYRSADRLPLTVFLSTGYPWDVDARTMKGLMEGKNYLLTYLEVPEGHSWGQWRAQLDDLLVYFFSPTES